LRQSLDAIVADRNAPQKHVWRASIVLLSADEFGTNAIISATGRTKTYAPSALNVPLHADV
jgi:hypothetical protein